MTLGILAWIGTVILILRGPTLRAILRERAFYKRLYRRRELDRALDSFGRYAEVNRDRIEREEEERDRVRERERRRLADRYTDDPEGRLESLRGVRERIERGKRP